jgi:membrane protease YdiL (CAAX protease family)
MKRNGPYVRTLAALLTCACLAGADPALAAVAAGPAGAAVRPATGERASGSLESAAAKAASTGRAVAMSLIGLAFAIAGTVLAFRRDFKEAAGVFAVGILSVLLATPAGVSLLRDTVTSLFGAQ